MANIAEITSGKIREKIHFYLMGATLTRADADRLIDEINMRVRPYHGKKILCPNCTDNSCERHQQNGKY